MTARLPGRIEDGPFVLRLWRGEDVEALHRAIHENLDHLAPWMAWISLEPLTLDQRLVLIEEWQTMWEDGAATPMAMLFEDEVVGGTGYVRREGHDATEIGYWVHVAHLGRGYATRAARLLTDAAFEVVGLPAIEIHHDKANVLSARVPPRLGYQWAGERPDDIAAPGEIGIDCTWRMTRRQWKARGPETNRPGQA
ncbi:MAG TPA: GNAT family protein [Acidimicrobiales bacterium]